MDEKPPSQLLQVFFWTAALGLWIATAKVAWPAYPHVPICGVTTTLGGAFGAAVGYPRTGAAIFFVTYWAVVIGLPKVLGVPVYNQ